MLTSLLVPYIFFSLLAEGRVWQMGCFVCCGIETFLPTTFSSFFEFLCRNTEGEGQLGWDNDMPCDRLSAAGAHSDIREIPSHNHMVYQNTLRHHPLVGLSNLGLAASFHVVVTEDAASLMSSVQKKVVHIRPISSVG
ncbi:hypothetical protein ACH5RR_011368 [Cinchona calisaya]|uniref:Uncharacterized protein n=1 Tax=Cinchona calisaya TaxID=153742 RepID=A0ABD3A8A7_9GENT